MTIYHLPEMTPMELPSAPIAMALGNFDGVHEGHRRLLSATRDAAEAIPGCLSGVWTFTALAKAPGDVPALTTAEEKLYRFAEAGLDFAILEDFSAVRTMSPETFVRDYLIGRLGCHAAVCGFNFRENDVAARWLKKQIIEYALSDSFAPKTKIDKEGLSSLIHGRVVKSAENTNFAFNPNDKTAVRKKK